MNKPKHPSCGVLDRLELLAISRTPCRICYVNPGQVTSASEGVIDNFCIVNGIEYLQFEGNPTHIRLDTIIEIQEENDESIKLGTE